MGDALLDRLVAERDQKLHLIATVKEAAVSTNRDLNSDDAEAIGMAKERVAAIDSQLDLVGDSLEMDSDTRERLRKLSPGSTTLATPMYRSAGELLWDVIHGTMGSQHSVEDQEAAKRYSLTLKRAAEHIGSTAAATTPVAGGFGGLFVQPILGPVIDIFPQGRPLVTALGTRPAPNSLTFVRPRIVDPSFKTGAAVQALEKGELTSKKFDIAVDSLTMATVGSYLNASVQLLSLHPTSLDIITGQLQKRVAWQSEAAAVAQLAATTAEIPLAANANAAAVLKAVYDAAALYYANTFSLPSWVAMGPTGWARLGSLVDSANRPMFPYLGAANAMGTSTADGFGMVGPAGLTPVVTPGITSPDLFVGGSDSLEVYEYPFPVLEAIEPSVMGRQIAVATALAFYMPTTKEATTAPVAPAEHNSVVQIVWAP